MIGRWVFAVLAAAAFAGAGIVYATSGADSCALEGTDACPMTARCN